MGVQNSKSGVKRYLPYDAEIETPKASKGMDSNGIGGGVPSPAD